MSSAEVKYPFGFPLQCMHVFWLVSLQDQGHNLFILCPPASFDLTFECCTFCSSITKVCAQSVLWDVLNNLATVFFFW